MIEGPLLLDTHVWLWTEGDLIGSLSREARHRIEVALQESELWITATSVWEACMLASKGRVTLDPDALTWIRRSLALPRRRLIPLTPEIAAASTQLPDAPVRDPSDLIILATARVEGVPLVTKDRTLLAYGRKHRLSMIAA